MELFDYMLGFEQGKKSGGGSGNVYTSIVDNGDNTITATDDKGVEHIISYVVGADGKITSVTLDGKTQSVTYEGDVLVKIGNTDVDMEDVPITEEGAGGLDHTVTFKTDENTTYQITSVNEDGQVSEPVEPPIPEERQSFIGWYTTDDVPQQVSFPYTPISNVELKAKFSHYRTYLEQTTTDYFMKIGSSYSYKKTYNDVSILGYTNRDENSAYSNPLFVSKTYNGAKLTRNTVTNTGNPQTLTYKGETWYYYWNYGDRDDVTVLIPNVVNMNKQQGFSNLLSDEEVALILIKIYLGELPLITE